MQGKRGGDFEPKVQIVLSDPVNRESDLSSSQRSNMALRGPRPTFHYDLTEQLENEFIAI